MERAKPGYRVVDNPFIVKLNRRTEIKSGDEVPGFPKYTFSLIPFDDLPQYTKKTDRFLGTARINMKMFIILHAISLSYYLIFSSILILQMLLEELIQFQMWQRFTQLLEIR